MNAGKDLRCLSQFTTFGEPQPLPSSHSQRHKHLDSLPARPETHLLGKVAIVTGAGSRIPPPPSSSSPSRPDAPQTTPELGNGSATALLLAESGATVLCVDKDLELAKHTARFINSSISATNSPATATARPDPNQPQCEDVSTRRGGQALAVEADVTSPTDCRAIAAYALSAFGRLDILVNVVGIMGAKGTAVDVDPDEWTIGLDINVTSMMLMAKYAIPAMLTGEHKTEGDSGGEGGGIRGSVVNVGSVAGLRGGTPHLMYPTSKGAVVNMTRAMAAQHGREGVRVNCVCPGMLYTPMMYRKGMSDEMRERRRKRSLLGTEGNVWDCAHAIRFLAGDEARWITGTVLTVDAGATASTAVL
ncbi:uncharacterized protein C8A04DRAFT_34077 [Dichotomopilus funicola]|uniref:Uncharacterized protein n=1 Tax=Dichotomopilus funicola TaxID=1934379 RepID=A0AAN6ZPW3_9PEZI|nr:hypothetical protein C8A04DRAFT_34077 [Dichotomopilus funicola]